MKFLILILIVLAIFSSVYADEAVTNVQTSESKSSHACGPKIHCKLEAKLLKKFQHNLIGLNTWINGQLLLSERNGHGLFYDPVHNRITKRVLLAPAHKDSCSHESTEDVEFDSMFVAPCGVLYKRDAANRDSDFESKRNTIKTLFNYHVVGDDNPSVAYSEAVNSKFFCQIFPNEESHPQTLANLPAIAGLGSTAFAALDEHLGNIVFMVDYDNNDILVQLGTNEDDCDNPLTRCHLHERITAIGTCCSLPLVFVGLADGQVHVYYFVSNRHNCKGTLHCIYKIPAPCNCNCISPIPIGIQLCCNIEKVFSSEANEHRSSNSIKSIEVPITVSILYRKIQIEDGMEKVKTFINNELLEFSFDLFPQRGRLISRESLGTIQNSEISSFAVCCPCLVDSSMSNMKEKLKCAFIYTLVKTCDNKGFLILYDVCGRFISKKELPRNARIRAWTVVPFECSDFHPPGTSDVERFCKKYPVCCCVYILFELHSHDDECERCPPKTALVRYCCDKLSIREE